MTPQQEAYLIEQCKNEPEALLKIKKMKLNWFTRKGIIYLPVSVIGWIILLAAFMLAIYMFIIIDLKSHSVSDTLINFVFNFLIIGLCYTMYSLGYRSAGKIACN